LAASEPKVLIYEEEWWSDAAIARRPALARGHGEATAQVKANVERKENGCDSSCIANNGRTLCIKRVYLSKGPGSSDTGGSHGIQSLEADQNAKFPPFVSR